MNQLLKFFLFLFYFILFFFNIKTHNPFQYEIAILPV